MYYTKFDTTKGPIYMLDIYKGGKKAYIVYRAIHDGLYLPIFPGCIFRSVDAALKAVEEKEA